MDQYDYQENQQQFKIRDLQLNHNNKQWVDRLVPLNEMKILIYFDGGEWILYDIRTNQTQKKGKIANNVKVFFQVWEGTLFYVCPDTLIVKLIDFNTEFNNTDYQFPASSKHNAQSEQNTREAIAEKLLVGLTQYEDHRFLVTIEQQNQYSYELPAIVYVRIIKENYDNDPGGLEQVQFKFQYPNATAQIEMFIYNTDPQSLVLFGQDFEGCQMEFALIKPHLGDKALRVIKIQDEQSFTQMNVTNWICDNYIAIWLNNNDKNAVPMIQIIDERLYYDSINNKYKEGDVPWKSEKVFVQFQDDPPQTLVDVIFFPYGCQYSVVQRLVGIEPYISLIDWQNHRLVHEFQLGDWNYIIPQNRDYIIIYDDNMQQTQYIQFRDYKSESINVKLFQMKPNPRYIIDQRYYILKLMEQSNITQIYGIDCLFDMFELINK
ncbi:hypothetical protein pb186bvf_003962 [Paramecium bursaria]